jgi:DNA-binding MarR family transcriptional regulator
MSEGTGGKAEGTGRKSEITARKPEASGRKGEGDGRKAEAVVTSASGPMAEVIQSWLAFLPSLDAAAFSIYLQLHQIDLLAIRQTNRIAEKHGMNSLDVNLLLAVRRQQSSQIVRPSDLWRRFDLAPSVITYRIDRLVELGLLVRVPHPEDRRALHLRLTQKGDTSIIAIVRQHNTAAANFLTDVDKMPGGRVRLEKLLGALLKRWEQGGP